MAFETDLLILGGGCAGLSLAMRLAELGENCPRTRIIEPRRNYVHDRTWCFWDDGSARLAPLIEHRWRKLTVRAGGRSANVDCGETRYCLLPADVFYAAALKAIATNDRIELVMDTTASTSRGGAHDGWQIGTNRGACAAKMVVDTRPDHDRAARDAVLWQSFVGFEIECAHAMFDSSSADLMNFRVSHADDIRFVYILPVSNRRALIEVTVFGRFPQGRAALLGELDDAIELATGGDGFEVLRWEHGALPMGHMQVPVEPDRSFVRVGLTSGGARASTGYAFQRIQRWADRCARSLAGGAGLIGHAPDPALLRGMDRLFLCVLRTQPAAAPEMFLSMFQNVRADRIIRFLSDQGTLRDYVAVASALPLVPFLKEIPAAFLQTPRLQVAR
jgi:lycopene beta-cyclase